MKDNQLFIGKVIALILVIISIFYAIYQVKDLRNNSTISVARIYDISHTKSISRNALYEYYYNGEKFKGVKRLKNEKEENVLKKFFEVKFSKENPRNSEINLAVEIIDTYTIKKANLNLK
ncbi:hypothetical protein [Psychroserpens sp. Hel_I_66]|uniref:hypothetical protein n=1 Tax=Psychroserpens sp. Hel_I_66 TaxID=1250004 RepID=UPI0006463BB7|nr:hypothetical protein [Psychroserpens sp. Hel_I_66]